MISVIIPTRNEDANLRRLLAQIAAEPDAHEVVVVDCGSGDETVAVAREAGARLIRAAEGRGIQLAAGAEAAGGDVLLFLHADSRFPAGGLAAIRRALNDRSMPIGGNFRLNFDGGDRFSRALTRFYRWMRRRGRYYGDSGIFVRHDVYDRLGGIRPIALMEDYDFTRRLERAGPTCCIDEPPLTTSSRRFAGRHPVAIVAGWIAIHALYHFGVSPARLARLYDRWRRPTPTRAISARR